VKYWEIFNEPDWVADWSVTQTWDTEPPGKADELVRFHGTIFDYVRMLRIASAVRDNVAPGTFILTGGLGYPSFLGALLRYTDNPVDGTVTDEYPNRGGDYFDVLSLHHYPHLVEDGNSDAALTSLSDARDAFLDELEAAKVTGKGFMMTETGAAHNAISAVASGADYARNYLQKAFVWSKAEGFLGVDWFTLSDGAAADEPFAQMGLYEDVSSLETTDEAVVTTSGIAYRTVSRNLADCRLDLVATRGMTLPQAARGYIFDCPVGNVVVIWALASSGETASAEVTVATTTPMTPIAWDGQAGAPLTPTAGSLSLTVASAPVFLLPTGP
jgi:hypothetical protein